MARHSRDSRLETPTVRLKLDRKQGPYFWRQMHTGAFVGYRILNPKAGQSVAGNWYVKYLHAATKTYKKKKLGVADDYAKADGVIVLNFRQAQDKANAVITKEQSDRGYTVNQAIDDYIKNYKIHNSPSDKTLYTAQSTINKYIKNTLGAHLVSELDYGQLKNWQNDLVTESNEKDELERYEIERKRKATANRVLTYLKAILNYAFAHRKELDNDIAWRKLKPFKNVESENIRPLSTAEAKRLINACPPDFRLLVRAALYTGCRYGELVAMRVSAYNSETERVTVDKRTAKSSKTRQIPLNTDGRKFFEQATAGKTGNDFIFTTSDGEPWGKSQQQRRMAEACRIAQVKPEATFHNLRDTYASMLVSKGTPMRAVADLLGHSDTRVTEKSYAQFQQSEKDKLVKKHLPSFGLEKSNVKGINQ